MESVINSLRKFWKSEAFIKTNKKMKALSWVSKVNNLLVKSLTDLRFGEIFTQRLGFE